MNHKLDITLNQIKDFYNNGDVLDLKRLLRTSVQFDFNLYSTEDRWNYTTKILQGQLLWICFGLVGLFNLNLYKSYNEIKVSEEMIGFNLGSTDEIIKQLQEIEKKYIKDRKHFYAEEYDTGPFLVVYEPITLKQFLENVKNKNEPYINSKSCTKYKHDFDVASALLKVLKK